MRSTKHAALAAMVLGLAAASTGSVSMNLGALSGAPMSLPRASGYRQGRRFTTAKKSPPPAGTKLARQAKRGLLTISRIR